MAAIGGYHPHQTPSHLRSSPPISIPVMASSSQRPSSALARGVKITEFTENRVNPDPIVIEDSDIFLEEFLSPRKLRDLTGMENLEEVHFLEMKVDTRDTSLGNFGVHVPNLTQLKLSNSIIQSIRDLGTCLNSLRILWMSRCGLEDIDSVSTMPNLRELYLAYNEISDISSCGVLENLQILDLEGNNIDSLEQVRYLAVCSSLANLTLEGNPVCVTPSPDETAPDYDYRAVVKSILPQVKTLDDEALASNEQLPRLPTSKASVSAFEDDWRLIDELLQDATINISDDESVSSGPSSSGGMCPSTSYRPGSALRPYTNASIRPTTAHRPSTGAARSGMNRPGSAIGRPGSGINRPGSARRPASSDSGNSRPGSGRPDSSEDVDFGTSDGSELTTGAVVCGNPSKALRFRRKPNISSDNPEIAKCLQEIRQKPVSETSTIAEDDEQFKEVMEKVKEWKSSHQQMIKDIQASKAAQVFVINHDEPVSASEDEEDESDDDSDEEETPYGPGRGQKPPVRIARFAPENYAQAARPKSRVGSAASIRRSAYGNRQSRLYDESFEARDDGYFTRTPEDEPDTPPSRTGFKAGAVRSLRSPSPVMLRSPEGSRQSSASSSGRLSGKIRMVAAESASLPATTMTNDRTHPLTRSSVHSPESSKPSLLRTPPDRQSVPQGAKIRKGQLANVQLLPSKPPNFSK